MSPTKSGKRNARELTVLLLGLAFAATSRIAAAGEIVRDPEHGFTWSIPNGFQASPALAAKNPKIIHAFSYTEPDGAPPVIVLYATNLGGTLGRERLTKANLPAGFKGSVFSEKWHDFEVDVIEVPEEVNGAQYLTYNAQIPLKKLAIQMSVCGPSARKAELLSLLRTSLDGLQGESNWTASIGAASTLDSRAYRIGLLIGNGLAFVGGVLILWLISRKFSPILTLVIAILLFAASLTSTSPALRLIGVTGIILGIVDLVRKPRRKAETQSPAGPADDGESRPGG
jgi:hypothetical protein